MSAMQPNVRSLSRWHGTVVIGVLVVIGLWLTNMVIGWFDRLLFSIGALFAIVIAGLVGDPLWNRFRTAWLNAEVAKGAPVRDAEHRFYREYEE